MQAGKTQIEYTMERELERKFDGPISFMPNALWKEMQQHVPKVYIFSVWPEEIRVDKGSLGEIRIPACPAGASHSPAYTIPGIVSTSYFDVGTGSMRTDDVIGRYIAQDIVHPFIGGDWSINNNLDDRGVFWTHNKIPTEGELEGARVKMEKTLRDQLTVATQFETTDQLEFITPMMRIAASYFKQDRAWNRVYKALAPCYACGGDVKAGVIIHACGAVMPGMWPLAVKAGLKSKAQALEAGVDLDAQEKTGPAPKGKGAGKPKDPDSEA